MMRYNLKHVALVLNCENLFDYRQNKNLSIYTGSITNPAFKQIWAPLDGRVINLSTKIDLYFTGHQTCTTDQFLYLLSFHKRDESIHL